MEPYVEIRLRVKGTEGIPYEEMIDRFRSIEGAARDILAWSAPECEVLGTWEPVSEHRARERGWIPDEEPWPQYEERYEFDHTPEEVRT